MPIIFPKQITAGSEMASADVNEAINDIASLVNGNLDSANLADGAVTGPKIAPGSLNITAGDIDFATFPITTATSPNVAVGTTPVVLATFTAPASGKYDIAYKIQRNQNSTSGAVITSRIVVNGTSRQIVDFPTTPNYAGNQEVINSSTFPVYLEAGDIVTIQASKDRTNFASDLRVTYSIAMT